MIIQLIVDALFTFFYSITGLVEIDISMAEEFLGQAFDMIKVAAYLLPMGTVSAIFSITVILLNFRIVIALLKTLWGILPLV